MHNVNNDSEEASSSVTLKFYRHFLTITIDAGTDKAWTDAVGLLGEYSTGNMLSRHGQVMQNVHEFGFEWQVRPDLDDRLFRQVRAPQLPYERCRLPTAARRRQLRQVDKILLQKAQQACGALQEGSSNLQLCIDDIMMTGDIGLAEAW